MNIKGKIVSKKQTLLNLRKKYSIDSTNADEIIEANNIDIENAIKNPDINFIGIEKFDSVIVKALQKIPEGLDNLIMLRADALNIDEIFDHEIDRIYLNFSDPWPKKRHHLRRLSSEVFLKKYENIFKDKKHILMRTDNKDLFTYSLVSFSTNGYMLIDISLDLHNDNMPDITTEYEDRFNNKGINIYYHIPLVLSYGLLAINGIYIILFFYILNLV